MTRTADVPRNWGLYRDSVVVDCLNVMRLTAENVAAARRAGLTAVNYTAVRPRSDLEEALRDLAAVRDLVDADDDLALVLDPEDLRRAKAEGKVGVVLGMQDAKPIRDDLALLRTFRDIGVRVVQLTHNTQGWIGTGCIEPDNGLTRFGRRVVEEMNRLGIVVDVAHCGPVTTCDAAEISQTPVLSSHANPRAICDSPRNKGDDVLEKLAERGGVVGIAAWSPICFRSPDRRPTIDDVLECFDHVLRLVGPEHVAIGSDLCDGLYTSEAEWAANHGPGGTYPEVTGMLGEWYGFGTWYAEGVESVDRLPDLAWALKERGCDGDAMRGVLGGNFVRVFEAAAA